MIGPYVSWDLPGGNRYGHALWSGTSYAAPVVSAVAACVWSEMRAQGVATNGMTVRKAIVGDVTITPDWTPGDARRLVRLLQRPP